MARTLQGGGLSADPIGVIRPVTYASWALLAAAGLATFVVSQRDQAAPSDADLREPAPVWLDDADNGFVLLERAAAELAVRLPEDEETLGRIDAMRKGETWDGAFVEGVLRENRHALAQLPAVLAAPDFASPPMQRLEDELPNMMRWILIARLSGLRALERARAGDAEAALADGFAPLFLARRVEGDRSAVAVHAMVATRLKAIGITALLTMLSQLPPPSAEEGRMRAAAIGRFHADPASWRTMWGNEYRVIRASFLAPVLPAALGELGEDGTYRLARWLPASYAYHPNSTMTLYSELFRELRASADRPCSELPPPREEPSTAFARVAAWLRPNLGGRALVRAGSSSVLYVALRRCESDAQLAAAQAVVALYTHQAERGSLPTRLEDLVPLYLGALPIDPYDGAPLRYDRKQRRLYSVGSRLPLRAPSYARDDGSFLAPEFSF